jgi:hypothetical protein
MAVESSCTPDGVSDLFIIYFATVDFVRVTFSYFNKQLLAGKKMAIDIYALPTLCSSPKITKTEI